MRHRVSHRGGGATGRTDLPVSGSGKNAGGLPIIGKTGIGATGVSTPRTQHIAQPEIIAP